MTTANEVRGELLWLRDLAATSGIAGVTSDSAAGFIARATEIYKKDMALRLDISTIVGSIVAA